MNTIEAGRMNASDTEKIEQIRIDVAVIKSRINNLTNFLVPYALTTTSVIIGIVIGALIHA